MSKARLLASTLLILCLGATRAMEARAEGANSVGHPPRQIRCEREVDTQCPSTHEADEDQSERRSCAVRSRDLLSPACQRALDEREKSAALHENNS